MHHSFFTMRALSSPHALEVQYFQDSDERAALRLKSMQAPHITLPTGTCCLCEIAA
jgi:hypothetical protein